MHCPGLLLPPGAHLPKPSAIHEMFRLPFARAGGDDSEEDDESDTGSSVSWQTMSDHPDAPQAAASESAPYYQPPVCSRNGLVFDGLNAFLRPTGTARSSARRTKSYFGSFKRWHCPSLPSLSPAASTPSSPSLPSILASGCSAIRSSFNPLCFESLNE
jgi:hypothetical protein